MKPYLEFKNALGHRESGNNYQVVNTLGFLGRFQFGKPRLWDLGFSIDGFTPKGRAPKKIITKEQFLNDPTLQDQLFDKHVIDYNKFANKRFPEFLGKEINGVRITVSGLIAGAHLLGWGNDKKDGTGKFVTPGVKHFLLSGIDSVDGFGTHISEYVNKFKDYEIPA